MLLGNRMDLLGIFWEFVNVHFFFWVPTYSLGCGRQRERLKAKLKPLPVAQERRLLWNSAVNH